jgi:hypothetical protein
MHVTTNVTTNVAELARGERLGFPTYGGPPPVSGPTCYNVRYNVRYNALGGGAGGKRTCKSLRAYSFRQAYSCTSVPFRKCVTGVAGHGALEEGGYGMSR